MAPKLHKDRGPTYSYPVGMLPAGTERSLPQAAETESGGDAAVVERPPLSAVKADWVTYAEELGIDTDGLTKDQIIERVDEAEG